jgi:hypothetical protein
MQEKVCLLGVDDEDDATDVMIDLNNRCVFQAVCQTLLDFVIHAQDRSR